MHPVDSENCILESVYYSLIKAGFRLVPKIVTLNDLELHNGRYFALVHPKPELSEAARLNELKLDA